MTEPRPRGRPRLNGPRKVAITISQPQALVDWLRGYAAGEKVSMAAIWTRALLEYRTKVENEETEA